MLTSVVAGGLGALLTIAIGSPLATRLANAHVWRRSAPADQFRERVEVAVRNFEPLDFGEDLMKWPSEQDRAVAPFPEPAWPSENWDDADFGRGAGRRAEEIVEKNAARQEQDTARRERRADTKAGRPERRHVRPEPRPTSPPKAAQRPTSQARPPAKRPPVQRAPPSVKKQASPPATKGGSAPPTKAELEGMIQSLGLAGTVQHLMRDNGWDFKTAAAWLARARKS